MQNLRLMSQGISQLHSHSGLEGALRFPKHFVLVDAIYASQFHKKGVNTIPFKHNGVEYIKVPTIEFVREGGVFKNLYS